MEQKKLPIITRFEYLRATCAHLVWSLSITLVMFVVLFVLGKDFPAARHFLEIVACLVGICFVAASVDLCRRCFVLPDCSRAHRRSVQQIVDGLPAQIHAFLLASGFRILPLRSVTDLDDSWKDEHPRGYARGDTYEHVGALTFQDRRLIVIAEKARSGRLWVSLDDHNLLAAAIEHEIGHAIDFSLGERPFSSTKEFIAAYDADVARLDKPDRDDLHYFLQPGEEGRQETFAEIFNAISLPWRDAQAFEQKFPNTTRAIKDRLASSHLPFLENKPFHDA